MQVNKSAKDRDTLSHENNIPTNYYKTDFDSELVEKQLNDSVIINDDFEDDEN